MKTLSSEFIPVPVKSILVERKDRQRTAFDPEDMKALRESLRTHGLMHPIVITRDLHLVAGERRLMCAKALKWETITAQYVDTLDPIQLRQLELEENTRRSDLSWQDRCRAIGELHRLYSEQNADWDYKKTGDIVRLSSYEVGRHCKLERELARGSQQIAEAPTYQKAYTIYSRIVEREADVIPGILTTATLPKLPERLDEETSSSEPAPLQTAPGVPPLYNMRFEEFTEQYTGPKFNFVHCDFPYGVNVGAGSKASTSTLSSYDDTPDVYWNLLLHLRNNMDTMVAESAHLMFWYAMPNHQKTLNELTKMGWKVNPYPLVWMKSDNRGLVPDSTRYGRRIYETAFFASRGDRKIHRVVNNAVYLPNERTSLHPSTKPAKVLKHFFSGFVDEFTIMLDPTCGGATSVFAALRSGAKSAVGVEQDPTFYKRAYENFWEHE